MDARPPERNPLGLGRRRRPRHDERGGLGETWRGVPQRPAQPRLPRHGGGRGQRPRTVHRLRARARSGLHGRQRRRRGGHRPRLSLLDADRRRGERLQRHVRRQQQGHLAPENRGGGRGRVHRLVRQLVRDGDEDGLAGRRSERNRRGFEHAYRRASWRAERARARQLVDRDGDADGRKRRRYRRVDRLLVRRRRNRELVGRACDVERGVRQRGRLDREHEKRGAKRRVRHRAS